MPVTTLPQVRRASVRYDFAPVRAWLARHQEEYTGKWIVLDGERLIGAGDDPRPLVAQARAEGVKMPFVKFIRNTSEPFMGGWL